MKILFSLLAALSITCHGFQIEVGSSMTQHHSDKNVSGTFTEKKSTATAMVALSRNLFSNFIGQTKFETSLQHQRLKSGQKLRFSEITFNILSSTYLGKIRVEPYIGLGVYSRRNSTNTITKNQPFLPFGIKTDLYTSKQHTVSAELSEDFFFFFPHDEANNNFKNIKLRTHFGLAYQYADWTIYSHYYIKHLKNSMLGLSGPQSTSLSLGLKYTWK